MVHGIRESFLKKVCTVNFWEDKGEYSPAKHGEYFNSPFLIKSVSKQRSRPFINSKNNIYQTFIFLAGIILISDYSR